MLQGLFSHVSCFHAAGFSHVSCFHAAGFVQSRVLFSCCRVCSVTCPVFMLQGLFSHVSCFHAAGFVQSRVLFSCVQGLFSYVSWFDVCRVCSVTCPVFMLQSSVTCPVFMCAGFVQSRGRLPGGEHHIQSGDQVTRSQPFPQRRTH